MAKTRGTQMRPKNVKAAQDNETKNKRQQTAKKR